MNNIAVRDLRPGMIVYIGSMQAKVLSAELADPPVAIAWGGQERAPAIKLELTIMAHPSEILSLTSATPHIP